MNKDFICYIIIFNLYYAFLFVIKLMEKNLKQRIKELISVNVILLDEILSEDYNQWASNFVS